MTEELARRDGLQRRLLEIKQRTNRLVDELRDGNPADYALDRDEYDAVLTELVHTNQHVTGALDHIDSSLARLAREQHQDEVVAVEQEVYGEGDVDY